MKRKTIKRIFLFFILFLPVQGTWVAVGWLILGLEPWPAFVFPSFGSVPGSSESVEVVQPTIMVTFINSQQKELPVRTLLSSLPISHHRAVMRVMFSPGEMHQAGGRAPEADLAAATVDWLAKRLGDIYPDRSVLKIEFRWRKYDFQFQGQQLVCTDTQFLGSLIAHLKR